MKNFILALSLTLAIGTVFTLNSCKKTDTTDDSQSAKDNTTISNAVNASTDDAASAAGQVQSFSGKTDGHWWNAGVLCGTTTVDSGTAGNRTITITYDNTTTCNGVIRSGTVTVTNTSGIRWDSAGAVLNISFNGLTVKDAVNGQTYTVNGSHTVTNVTGGLAWKVAVGLVQNTTVTHHITGSMSVTFSDNSQRTWNLDRTRSWSSAGNVITVSLLASTNSNGETWGTNRYGVNFSNTITQTIAANNVACPNRPYRPYTGTMVHHLDNNAGRTVTMVFGTNSTGTQIGNPTTCGEGYYVTYQHQNKTRYAFVPYW